MHAHRVSMRTHFAAAASVAIASSATTARAGEPPPCDQIPTFEDGLTPSFEIHVATTGNNQTGDGSIGNPYATISRAVQDAAPGAAIRIHEGTYSGGTFISGLEGATGAPIWIGGAQTPGEAPPIISGAGEGLHLSEVRWLILHDLEITGASQNGVNCDDGGEYNNPDATRHVIFRNLHIHDVGSTGNQDGLKLSGVDDFLVLDCTIERWGGGGSAIDMVGCHAGLIARCAIAQGGSSGVQCKGGSEDIEIRWCRIENSGQRPLNIGGSTGFEFFRPPLSASADSAEARNIRVLGNVIIGGVTAMAFVGAEDCLAAHNTIIAPTSWIMRILQETTSGDGFTFVPCRNNRFESNLVWFDRSDLSAFVNVGPNTAPETFTFSHCLWWAFDNPAQSAPSLPAPQTSAVIGQNPLLASPAAGEYWITPGSPAIAAANAPSPLEAGIGGACFCDSADIGAYSINFATGESCAADCPADLNADGAIGSGDLAALLAQWGPCARGTPPCSADLNADESVNASDLALLLASWGACG